MAAALYLGQFDFAEGADRTADPREIDAAIQQLGHARFSVRDSATNLLWQSGAAAQPALEIAAHSDDREVAYRANLILERFKYGIYPDTPPEVIELVRQFRKGDLKVKQIVLRQLQASSQIRTMFVLLDSEVNQELKQQLTRGISANIENAVSQTLLEGDFAEAEQLLEWAASIADQSIWLRNYATFLSLQNKLDIHISQLQKAARYDQDAKSAQRLAYLLWADGQYAEARKIAQKANDPSLVSDLLYRLDDWKTLASPEFIPGNPGIEQLSFAATFHRQAGNQAEFENTISEIHKLVEKTPPLTWYACEALMINDRWQEAIDLHAKHTPYLAFKLLREQLRFDEAFQCVGIADPVKGSARWFGQHAADLSPTTTAMTFHVRCGLEVARALDRLGAKQESQLLLTEIAKVANDPKGLRMQLLAKAQYDLGLKRQAMQHAALAVEQAKSVTSTFSLLFADDTQTAQSLWALLCRMAPDEDRGTTMFKVHKLLRPTDSKIPLDLPLEDFLNQAITTVDKYPPNQQAPWFGILAEVCVAHEQFERARAFFQKQVTVDPSDKPLLRIGDLWADQGHWQLAAQAYARAFQASRQSPLALFLQGHAITRTDDLEKGQSLIDLANLLPLANVESRRALAEGLKKRGLKDETNHQWEMILRVGPHDGWSTREAWAVKDAARWLGEDLSNNDHLRAADLCIRRVFYLLAANLKFKYIESYPWYMHKIHNLRATGLLQAGQVDAGITELWLAHAALPGEIHLPIKLSARLQAAGRSSEAEQLFSKVYQSNARVCDRFPNSAYYHYRLASLCARCGQRPDDALAYAKRAVELEPDSPLYLDTLAEVHFRSGQRDQAVQLAKQCVALSPDSTYYQRQLARFMQPR